MTTQLISADVGRGSHGGWLARGIGAPYARRSQMASTARPGTRASELLASSDASPDDLEAALDAVVCGGPAECSAFGAAFGPRRLLKALGCGMLSDRASELADELLAACDGGALAPQQTFGETLYVEELCPDELVDLTTPATAALPPDVELVALSQAAGGARVAFAPAHCVLVGAATPPSATAPVLRLRNPSRRARIGSELECKVWPSAIILGRWMWRHASLLRGKTVLELGAGVGTAGLAAAACGAHRVVLTDINAFALTCARRNAACNGEAVRGAACVHHLDWASPPILDGEPAADDAPAADDDAGGPTALEIGAMLARPFDVIIAADVINNVGLSEMLYATLLAYLPAHGLFLMTCPKSRHRFAVERIRSLLFDSVELEAHAAAVPPWLREGIEEAEVVEHELIVVQRRDRPPPAAAAAAAPGPSGPLAAHFAALGLRLGSDVSDPEVRAAYRQRVRDFHPDGGRTPDGAAYRAACEAHAVLTNVEARAAAESTRVIPQAAIGLQLRRMSSDDDGGEPAAAGRAAYGFASVQGQRPSMEDVLLLGADLGAGVHAWGVFDGHGGIRAARYLERHLPEALRPLVASHGALPLPAAALTAAFEALDERLLDGVGADEWNDGATCLLVLTQGAVVQVCQVGDGLAVGCDAHGRATALCTRHRPDEPTEAARLEAAGALVRAGRVNGLAVSRAFGDRDCKVRQRRVSGEAAAPGGRSDRVRAPAPSAGIVCAPDCTERRLTADDDLLLLGCDGLWDVLSADEVCAVARRAAGDARDLQAAAKALADAALDRGSSDNVSVLVVSARLCQ